MTAICRLSAKPSDGLEPSTPSLPRLEKEPRPRLGQRGHESRARRRNRPQISDRVCPSVPALMFFACETLWQRRRFRWQRLGIEARQIAVVIDVRAKEWQMAIDSDLYVIERPSPSSVQAWR
jgi:hypothetical protein